MNRARFTPVVVALARRGALAVVGAVALVACGALVACPSPAGPPADDAGPSVVDDAGAVDDRTGGDDGGRADRDDAGDAAPIVDDAGAADAGAVDAGAPDVAAVLDACFAGIASQTGVEPDYVPFAPTIGGHCAGTNHQDIVGVERVVFLGDSVTVGSPPTTSGDFYRNRLAERLAARFDLQAPGATWKAYDPLGGTSLARTSGDFASCAKWGARTDDLQQQIDDCFPVEERAKRTLVVMTIGGNDVAAFTKDGLDGVPLADITVDVQQIVQLLDDAVARLKDPAQFPGGVHVVFANPPEFTDGTGDTQSCPAASVAGFSGAWEDPAALAELVVYMLDEYMRIAVQHDADLVFFLETFCGHGYHHDDPQAACYRGAGAERWFDATCIHPNPTGHGVLADLFYAVVAE